MKNVELLKMLNDIDEKFLTEEYQPAKNNRLKKTFIERMIEMKKLKYVLAPVCMLMIGFVGFVQYNKLNTNTGKIENLGKVENVETENTTISNANSNKFMAPFKYDLKNNQLSNFDIAFLKVENGKENKIYSPLSIKYTLKMLEEGANGPTKQQISDVLEDYVVTKYTSNKNMSLANALFVRNSFKDSIKQNYITDLKNEYNAEVVFDSFADTKNVNGWVKEKTLDIIPEIIDDIGGQDFLLINALGIDMEWENKFLDIEHIFDKGFENSVSYLHEEYSDGCNVEEVQSRKFDDEKLEVSGMEIFASMDNYDIVNILGEDNIRKTVEEKYREWIKENGTNAWGEKLNGSSEIEKEVENYLDEYIKEIKSNYSENGEVRSIDFSLYTDDNVKAFAKDLKEYNGTTLQYIGIMPTNEDLDEYVKSIDSNKVNDIIDNLKELKRENFKDGVITRIKGFIPKFNFEYSLRLKDDLAQIGITDIFDSEKADISGLTSVNGEYIGDAIHKANIEFTQDGIKAAAVTIGGGAGAGEPEFDYIYEVPIEDIDLTFDKPYMFIIRDKDTGDVWFAGTVYEPLAWEDDTTRTTMEYFE